VIIAVELFLIKKAIVNVISVGRIKMVVESPSLLFQCHELLSELSKKGCKVVQQSSTQFYVELPKIKIE